MSLISMGIMPMSLFAQTNSGLALTLTPPLFQLSIGPGETWSSGVTVVNPNPYDLTVYARPVRFEAQGEEGHGKFLPVMYDEEGAPTSLAGWIETISEPVVIPREQTFTIPFTVSIPEDASPGGHYAALLIGNQPPKTEGESVINITSSIASLLLVNVGGEVIQKGRIRDFFSDRAFYQDPTASLTMRFENHGNVHLQPQGAITVYNMWGKQRGEIPINRQSEFGNVLPGSVRKFAYTWYGEPSIYDIGRYKAVAELSFGRKGERLSAYRETHFWVIPIMSVLKITLALCASLFFIIYAVRKYIRRALKLEAERLGVEWNRASESPSPEPEPQTQPIAQPSAPMEAKLQSRRKDRPGVQATSIEKRHATHEHHKLDAGPAPKPKEALKPTLELKTLMAPIKASVADVTKIRSFRSKPAPTKLEHHEHHEEPVKTQSPAVPVAVQPGAPRRMPQTRYQPRRKRTIQQSDETISFITFMRRYLIVFAFLAVVGLLFYWVSTFFSDVLTNERDFEIKVERVDDFGAPVE